MLSQVSSPKLMTIRFSGVFRPQYWMASKRPVGNLPVGAEHRFRRIVVKFFQISLKGVFLGHIGVADKVAVGYGAGGGVGFRVSRTQSLSEEKRREPQTRAILRYP